MHSVTENVRKFQTSSKIPVSLTDITLSGKPAKPINKTHISKFLILVNSNVASDDPLVQDRIVNCLKSGFEKSLRGHEEEIFKIRPPAVEQWGPEHVFSIESKIVAEVGTIQKRIHIHALVTVTHDTIIQMDSKAIRTLLLDHCADDAIRNLFVRIRFVPVSDFAELYLYKDPIAVKV